MVSVYERELRRVTPAERTKRQLLGWSVALVATLVLVFIYSGAAWTWFRPVLHKPIINKYAGQYKCDPLWVMAFIKVESGFLPHALSPRGAVGLMQLLPSTARDIAPEAGLQIPSDDDLKDPDINLHLGVYYLSKLNELFPDDETAVLAAYNAGPGITSEWRRGKPFLELPDIAYPETKQFVKNVERTYGFLKMVQGWKYLFGMTHAK